MIRFTCGVTTKYLGVHFSTSNWSLIYVLFSPLKWLFTLVKTLSSLKHCLKSSFQILPVWYFSFELWAFLKGLNLLYPFLCDFTSKSKSNNRAVFIFSLRFQRFNRVRNGNAFCFFHSLLLASVTTFAEFFSLSYLNMVENPSSSTDFVPLAYFFFTPWKLRDINDLLTLLD